MRIMGIMGIIGIIGILIIVGPPSVRLLLEHGPA